MTQESNKSLCKETTMKTTHKNARQRLEGNKEDAKSNVKEDEQNMLKICKREWKRGYKQNNGTSSNISHTQTQVFYICVGALLEVIEIDAGMCVCACVCMNNKRI